MFVGADRRDMDNPRACGSGRAGHRLRTLGLDGVEPLAAPFEQDADQVDDDIGVAYRGFDRMRNRTLACTACDLADAAERLQMSGQFRSAHRDADEILAIGQRAH